MRKFMGALILFCFGFGSLNAQENNHDLLLTCTFEETFPDSESGDRRDVSIVTVSDDVAIWQENGKNYDTVFVPSGISHGGQRSFLTYRDIASTDTLVIPGACMAKDCWGTKIHLENGIAVSMTSQQIQYDEIIVTIYAGICELPRET